MDFRCDGFWFNGDIGTHQVSIVPGQTTWSAAGLPMVGTSLAAAKDENRLIDDFSWFVAQQRGRYFPSGVVKHPAKDLFSRLPPRC
jgi:hypothetical protein